MRQESEGMKLGRRKLLIASVRLGGGAALLGAGAAATSASPSSAAGAELYASRYVADLSVPDGTRVTPGEKRSVGRRIQNTGTGAWRGFAATRVGGNFGPARLAVRDVGPGQVADLWHDFTFPPAAGSYTAVYRMVTSANQPFGVQWWVKVAVVNQPAPPAGDQRMARAAAWAREQIGSYAWGSGTNTYCETFAENAYGTSGRYPTARAAADVLARGGAVPNVGGTLVFFNANAGNGWAGHVGIYLGNDRMISVTSSGVREASVDAWSRTVASYRGWANPPTGWPGR